MQPLRISLSVVLLLLAPGRPSRGEDPVQARAEDPGTHVILILADDLGWSDLGCYGNRFHQTPALDALAGESIRFTQAYAAAPVCTPTRASLLTGVHPARLHMTIWHESAVNRVHDRPLIPPDTVADLPQEQTTLAEYLQAAGYRTAHVGKWHLGGASHYPEVHGFDRNIGGTLWGAPQTFFYPFNGDQHFGDGFRYVPGLEPGKPGDYLTDRLTDRALALLEEWNEADERFFLHLSYHSVHTPIEARPEDVARFQAAVEPGAGHRNPVYAAMLARLDWNIGRVLGKLDELGLTRETLVVFLSDNGGYIGSWDGRPVTDNAPLRSGKGSLYEGGIRIPLLIRGPGLAPGLREQPVSTCDLLPTILSLSGITASPERELDGRDLCPILGGSETATLGDRDLFFHYPHYYPTTTPVGAIRSGDWKLLEYFEEERTELYHLGEDLSEERDLAGERSEIRERLLSRLRQWRLDVKAQMPKRRVP